ncbi:ABC transporter substrate-binding protein [Leucobacter sp. UT-8R-CII-1-4]|uniref:ABC transporter substrate-binding protein n=1 Tax=Leucobacter sp. UT-8R-CII-1-4 TaxID=3040075 RepID=UPI0024A907D7|nr:ABC transporter substrate-binding protein [Leucobacter sp. UT-8R-CII-1-4]MDI6022094.1 ABC transporter substrate-binding protein [Leucobacter sp. UT-8R-CII-1-4]
MNKHLIVAVAAIGALALTSCSGGGSGAGNGDGEPVIDGTMRYGLQEDPGNLFRLTNANASLSNVYPWAYESPIYYNSKGEASAWLATDWEETPSSLKLTIRDDAVCSDGTKLTAETVANNYRWIADPANGSAFIDMVIPSDAVVENDENTVTVTTGTANSFLLTAIGTFPIYCQAALDDPSTVASATNGTGLYQLTEAVPGDHYTLERRDDYTWAPENGPIGSTPGVPKEVVISVIENASTRANLLLSGDLNIASVPGPDGERVAETMMSFGASQINSAGLLYTQFDGKPTADIKVRTALTQALDLDSLMQVATSGKGERAQRLAVVQPQVCIYDAATPNLPKTDVAAAEALLDEAGWKKGSDGMRAKDGKPLVLNFGWSTRWAENAATAEQIGDQWTKIGIKVNHVGSDAGAFNEKLFTEGSGEEFDVMWIAPNYPVPTVLGYYFMGATPPQGNNFAGINNEKFNELVAATSEYAGAEACDAWEKAEAEMYSSVDYVPFAMRTESAYGNGVKGVIDPYGQDTMVTGLILVD